MFKDFYIKDLFEVINNPQLDKDNFTFNESAEYPYFTRTENNNGILGYVEYLDEKHKIKGNSLAVGMISMKFHYMHHDFYAGQFTKTLIPNFQDFNETIAMYFIAILNKHSEYYQSFLVRHFKDKVSETVVPLPVIESLDPDHEYTTSDIDWQSVQNFIAKFEHDSIVKLDAYMEATGLNDYELNDEDKEVLALSPKFVSNNADAAKVNCGKKQIAFKTFTMHDIFEPLKVTKAKKSQLSKMRTEEFCVPVVYAKFGDNGIMYWGRKGEFTTYENVISIVYNGVISAGKVNADRKSTRLNSSHEIPSRMPSSA